MSLEYPLAVFAQAIRSTSIMKSRLIGTASHWSKAGNRTCIQPGSQRTALAASSFSEIPPSATVHAVFCVG